MIRLDYENQFLKYYKQKKIKLLFLLLLLLVLLLIFVLSLMYATYENRNLVKTIGSIAISIVLIFYIYIYQNSYLFLKRNQNEIQDILMGYLDECEGVIIDIIDVVHLANDKTAKQYILDIDGQKKNVYVPLFFSEPSFNIGDRVSLKISKSFIVMYEVIEDEK